MRYSPSATARIRPDELTRSGVVEDVRRRARLDGREQLVVAASVAEEHDGGARALVLQPLDRGNDLVDRQLGVDEDDVRHRVADHVDRFIDVGRPPRPPGSADELRRSRAGRPNESVLSDEDQIGCPGAGRPTPARVDWALSFPRIVVRSWDYRTVRGRPVTAGPRGQMSPPRSTGRVANGRAPQIDSTVSQERSLVEMRGLEPLTPAMRTRCSSS